MPKRKLTEGDYPRIAIMAAKGLREQDIARELNVSADTWRRLRRENRRASIAWERGRGEEHQALVSRLYQIAMSDKPTAAASAMFLLKCRHGYRETAPVADTNHNVRVEISLPASLKPEQYSRLVQKHPKVIEAETTPGPEEGAPLESDRGEP